MNNDETKLQRKKLYNLLISNLKGYKFPTDIIFFVTNKCNSKCRGCFYWYELNKKIDELKLTEIKKISESIGQINSVRISGGEPFLRNDLSKILDIIIDINKPRHITIPTNGSLNRTIIKKTRDILTNNKNFNLSIGLPLDGFKETHDYLRGIEGHFDTVIRTVNNLCQLKKEFSNLSIYIITTVSNKNYNEIESLFRFVKKNLSVNIPHYHPIRGVLKDKNLVPPSGEEWSKLATRLIKYKYSKNNDKITAFFLRRGGNALNRIIASSLDGKKWPFICKAGNRIGVLEPEGSVRLCELTEKIGNLRDFNYDFKKLWLSRKAEKVRNKIKSRECTRGCTHGCFLLPSFISNPISVLKKVFYL